MEFSKELIESANLALTKSIMQLMRTKELAFDTSIILNMPREFISEEDKLMQVSGTTLKVNPVNFLNLSENDQQWNIRHTAWHVIGFDEVRIGERNPELWNMASDLWVNSMLTHDESFKANRPQDAVYSPQFKDWEKEDIYNFLEQNQQEQEKHQQDPMKGDCDGKGQPSSDSDEEGDGNSQSNSPSPEQLEKQIQSMVQQAAMQAKQAGGIVPNCIEEYLENLYNPKLPWSSLLLKYMDSHNTFDYSYQRINKAFFAHNLIMPTLYSEGLGHIMIATDESCSVSDKDLELYLGAIKAIKDELDPELMTVMGFTTQVDHVNTIDANEDIDKIKFRVHGGTHIPKVFDYIEENKMNPQVLIVFSDMESAFPQHSPNFDVIFICVGNPKWIPPFGRAIYVES